MSSERGCRASVRRGRMLLWAASVWLALSVPPAAAQSPCASPVTNGAVPTSRDCRFIMRAAIGLETCEPSCVCRPSGGETVRSLDALLCLAMAVALPVRTYCPCSVTTTTTLPPPSGACTDTAADCTSDLECLDTCHQACITDDATCRDRCFEPGTCREPCEECTHEPTICSRLCRLCRDACRVNCETTTRECHFDCDEVACDGIPDSPRFEDTGLTIRDHSTRLEWEKKTEENVGDRYAWTVAEDTLALVGDFLAGLNNRFAPGGCFAGHCDWRMPTVAGIQYNIGDEAELESIHESVPDCGVISDQACILSIFGPTVADAYWSSSLPPDRDDGRCAIRFDSSSATSSFTVLPSTTGALVRAVRDF